MGDFFLDFRIKPERNLDKIMPLIKYFEDVNTCAFEFDAFTLLLSRVDSWDLWGPYWSLDGMVFVALSGRIALDETKWEEARNCLGKGGLACKAIYTAYSKEGVKSFEELNGNYVVFIYDKNINKFYIATDRCGMFPCYWNQEKEGPPVLCSHPDVLAVGIERADKWDFTSMTEFLMTGQVSFPYSYYQGIKALDFGCLFTINLKPDGAVFESSKKYFAFDFKIDHGLSEWELAEELALAFRKAVRRRTLSLFGQSAVALSGGLDSRMLLCAAEDPSRLKAFCLYDDKNMEYRVASRVANELGVSFLPMKRPFDYYGDNAEKGVNISGGMGAIHNNHYLGIRQVLQGNGINNLLTGCYCDYLFKGLALDKKTNRYLRISKMAEFQYEFYMPCFWPKTQLADSAKGRLDSLFPEEIRKDRSDAGRVQVEVRRLFPLYHEVDNVSRRVLQGVFPWYPPSVDNDVVSVYLKIPPHYKLNLSIYSKVMQIQCGKKICAIPNSNTWAKIGTFLPNLLFHCYLKALSGIIKDRLLKKFPTDESWPNWGYYLCHSRKIRSLWFRRNNAIKHYFALMLGEDPFKKDIRDFKGGKSELFYRLLTLKLWIEQREPPFAPGMIEEEVRHDGK
jgi:asparagine synthase (glutamine-hydrolysing)